MNLQYFTISILYRQYELNIPLIRDIKKITGRAKVSQSWVYSKNCGKILLNYVYEFILMKGSIYY